MPTLWFVDCSWHAPSRNSRVLPSLDMGTSMIIFVQTFVFTYTTSLNRNLIKSRLLSLSIMGFWDLCHGVVSPLCHKVSLIPQYNPRCSYYTLLCLLVLILVVMQCLCILLSQFTVAHTHLFYFPIFTATIQIDWQHSSTEQWFVQWNEVLTCLNTFRKL